MRIQKHLLAIKAIKPSSVKQALEAFLENFWLLILIKFVNINKHKKTQAKWNNKC